MTDTAESPTRHEAGAPGPPERRGPHRLEVAVGVTAGLAAAAAVVAEPGILGAPFQNGRTLAVGVGGPLVLLVAYVVMVRRGIPPLVRVLLVGVPVAAAAWWLVSPYFVDEVVEDRFETSIADASRATVPPPAPAPTTAPAPAGGADPSAPTDPEATTAPAPTTAPPAPPAPVGPTLLGVGEVVGLAGHEGTGDAAFFRLEDGSLVLRFEGLDIENGPDLRLYVQPGRDQHAPTDAGLSLGELRGNVGDQTYELPADLDLTPGDWTVLVWCEAFTVEFVAANVAVG